MSREMYTADEAWGWLFARPWLSVCYDDVMKQWGVLSNSGDNDDGWRSHAATPLVAVRLLMDATYRETEPTVVPSEEHPLYEDDYVLDDSESLEKLAQLRRIIQEAGLSDWSGATVTDGEWKGKVT